MSPKSPPLRITFWLIAGILGLMLAISLGACTTNSTPLQPQAATPSPIMQQAQPSPSHTPTERPTQPATTTAVPTSTPSPTLTPIEETIPFPTSLEAFGMVYDENATLEIPPLGSNAMLFWGQALPVRPVESTPEFIAYPTPQLPPNSGNYLAQEGCRLDEYGFIACPQDSPLSQFGCDYYHEPQGIDSGLEPRIPLVATCEKETEEWEAAKAGGVVLSGCAFQREIHYIFKIENEYVLVSSEEELKDLFAPIDSPAEALSYAQLVTGLEAFYGFTYDPTLMYFAESVEGSHVTQIDGGFEMNLFNFAACSCEPWINSQIIIQVDPAGEVSWVDAVPVFMTTGLACAD